MENQRELTVLLIEDDKFACEEIRNYIDQLDDMRLLGITDDSNKALDMVKYCVPDAIILDLELHDRRKTTDDYPFGGRVTPYPVIPHDC